MNKTKSTKKAAKKKPMSYMLKVLGSLKKDLGYKTNSLELLKKHCGRG